MGPRADVPRSTLIALGHQGVNVTVAIRRAAGTATTSWFTTAGIAACGAGAIHAAAIGVHAEHRQASLAFTAIALAQLAVGGVAVLRRGGVVAMLVTLVNGVALGGWLIAKSSGIAFIDGLETAEPVQLADATAAALALASIVLVAAGLLAQRTGRLAFAGRLPLGVVAAALAALTTYGMAGASEHDHAHDTSTAAGEVRDASEIGGNGDDQAVVAAPVDTAAPPAAPAVNTSDSTTTTVAATTAQATTTTTVPAEHSHPPATAALHRYDPKLPIDLSGVPGVTPEQQAAAENIIAVTLAKLPQWADPAVAEAAGFRSIGDGVTGIEHFVNSANMEDEVTFDPDHPESLVYDTSDGGRRLVAAMYMLKRGTPLEDAPNVGGALMQWHTHDNLCFNAEGHVAGLTDDSGNGAPGLLKPVETPMIHVGIEAHACGPFAALEGIGGGRILEGEERLCDTAHGSHG